MSLSGLLQSLQYADRVAAMAAADSCEYISDRKTSRGASRAYGAAIDYIRWLKGGRTKRDRRVVFTDCPLDRSAPDRAPDWEVKEEVHRLLSVLSEREWKTIRRFYFDGWTYLQIAKAERMNFSQVGHLMRGALEKMRAAHES